jgi:hypothetical protein
VHFQISVFGLLLTAFIAALLGFCAGRQALMPKSIGEALLANAVEAKFSQPHYLLNNVTLPKESGTTQIDHILVAATGIFVIETKHYQGWIFGDPKKPKWTQVIYRKKRQFQNPVHQNYGHLKTVQELFNLPELNFFSVVVFTGDAEFKTELGPNVFNLPKFLEWLSLNRPQVFDERKMAYILGRIEMQRLRWSRETDEYHLNHVRVKLARREQLRIAS